MRYAEKRENKLAVILAHKFNLNRFYFYSQFFELIGFLIRAWPILARENHACVVPITLGSGETLD